MRSTTTHAVRLPRRLHAVLLAAAGALVALAMLAAPSFAASKTLHLKTAKNATVGKTVLVTPGGMTLYTLNAETRSKLICTSDCLGTWIPLRVKEGVTPTGAKHLGTFQRKEGFVQVTFKGRPVYRFSGDQKKGDAAGEGLKDVGTWHVISVPARATGQGTPDPSPAPGPSPAPAPGYGYY